MSGKINRRDFLKVMGWGGVGTALSGCDLPSTVTLEEGKEEVVSYLMPEEYVIPGIGVWYASTCAQCPAGCGIHGRVREGRALKLEGNPDSPVSNGKLCMMGQAGVQGHYNPDRITKPLLRKNGELVAVSWDEAQEAIRAGLSGVTNGRVAWVTGAISGHQAALVTNHLSTLGSTRHYVHETVNTAVLEAVNRDMFGEPMPQLRLDKAQMVLSFGADFLGTWVSPVHFSTQYTRFRTQKQRGLLVQVEPKMSLTGANADLWLPIRPGTEGVLALGIANLLLNKLKLSDAGIPAAVRDLIDQHDVVKVARITDVPGHRIQRLATLLQERSPSLVLAGPGVGAQQQGYASTAAVMMLNHILGNVGKTMEARGAFPFPQLQARSGGTRDLVAFANAARDKELDAVIIYGTNPVFSAPAAVGVDEVLGSVPFKLVIAQFADETTRHADVVLPAASYLEDFGTHVAAYQAGEAVIGMQQPLMEPLYAEVRGFGDIALGLLKMAKASGFEGFPDYYGYLRHAFANMPAALKSDAKTDADFWNGALQKGQVKLGKTAASLSSKVVEFKLEDSMAEAAGALTLLPVARLGLFDGRHANLPWLQEAPDQIVKVVWDSWAELHPQTAQKLGVKQGDTIKITSAQGAIQVKVALTKSVHQEVVAVPLGQGHTHYGRYASGIGANPLKVLDTEVEPITGELALHGTRVQITKAGTDGKGLVRMGGSDTQHGRRFVRIMPAEQLKRTEGV